MPDVTISVGDALGYLTARRVMQAAQREPVFPVGYVLGKFDRKIPAELTEYEKARVAKCEELCEKDEQGKPKTNGQGYVFPDGAVEVLNAFLAPLHAEPITLTNVRKLKPSEMLTKDGQPLTLSKVELDGLFPIIDDSGEEPHA